MVSMSKIEEFCDILSNVPSIVDRGFVIEMEKEMNIKIRRE